MGLQRVRHGWAASSQRAWKLHAPFPKPSLYASLPFAAAVAAKSLQSCPTLCDPIDSSPPGSPVPGILQARTLEWVAIFFSRGSSQPRDRIRVSCIERFIEIKVWGKGNGASMPSLRGLRVFICMCSCVHQLGNSPKSYSFGILWRLHSLQGMID